MRNETTRKAKPTKDASGSQNSLAQWLRLQRSLAEKNGIALVTFGRDSLMVGRVENDNSICRAMRESPQHARLCEEDCSNAYNQAVKSGRTVEYRCHAGLNCFAIPVSIEKRQLVILGGRAFTSSADYNEFLRRFRYLSSVESGECLKSIRFVNARELRDSAQLVASSAEYHFQTAPAQAGNAAQPARAEEAEAPRELLDAHLKIISLGDQLEIQKKSIAHMREFFRSIAPLLDSQRLYTSLLAKMSDMAKSERVSLMVFNPTSGELAVEAALPEIASPIRVRLGEGIAGLVLESGSPMIVRDVDSDPRVPAERPGKYRTRSFISYPLVLGHRKVGVLNLSDKADGTPYESEDLDFLELMAPQIALIIERTEWHRKAEQFQRMSLTDPLTGLPNRRYFEERLFEEVERSKRHGTALSFMIIDVDRFKSYNDIYGHTEADGVLVKTSQLLRRSVRAIDMTARFAGDEFCIVLPETKLAAAGRIAERLRKSVNQTEFRSETNESMGRVTISIGVSSFSPSRQSPLSIIETADRALYKAKTRGRNCVAIYEDDAGTG
ncbi:MAG TPA: diguanylate cyclase [Blastocatellia bacterium]|nr:diguanylate cyclase [Blastocatellia bacterium]